MFVSFAHLFYSANCSPTAKWNFRSEVDHKLDPSNTLPDPDGQCKHTSNSEYDAQTYLVFFFTNLLAFIHFLSAQTACQLWSGNRVHIPHSAIVIENSGQPSCNGFKIVFLRYPSFHETDLHATENIALWALQGDWNGYRKSTHFTVKKKWLVSIPYWPLPLL